MRMVFNASRFPASLVALAFAATLAWGPPAHALEYTVEGQNPQRVVVQDDLLVGGVSAVLVGYGMALLMGGLFYAASFQDDEGPGRHNGAIGLALSTPPLVNGALLGRHLLDQQEAYDSREGWAALPSIAAWSLSAIQLAGLGLVAGAILLAERTPVGE